MNVEKKNFKEAANEDNYSVEIFIDKFTGELCYRNSLGQKVLIYTKTHKDEASTGGNAAGEEFNQIPKY
jgi:hypothetical protein